MQLTDNTPPPTLLLTIAIPTYNRADYLDLCLKRISEELDSLGEDLSCLVKVYISNNASTDHTEQVAMHYQQMKSGDFELVCNPENIGADRNITQCYTSATTPYVWVLGDDDVILPHKLRVVLDVLSERDVDILYLNGYGYSDDYLDEPKRGRNKNGIVEYYRALDFVRHVDAVMLTFITALIVRRGIKIEPSKKIVEGSNLPQLSWILPLIRDGKKFTIIKNRVYAAKLENVSYETGNLGNAQGYGAVNIFGHHLTRIANDILKEQLSIAQAIQNGAIVLWFPIYIMNFRRDNHLYSKEDFLLAMKSAFQGNWRYYVFLAPLIVLPIPFARLYFLLIRVTRLLFRAVLI